MLYALWILLHGPVDDDYCRRLHVYVCWKKLEIRKQMRICGAKRFWFCLFEDMFYVELHSYTSLPSRGDLPLYMSMHGWTTWFYSFWMCGPAALRLFPEWPNHPLFLLHSSLKSPPDQATLKPVTMHGWMCGRQGGWWWWLVVPCHLYLYYTSKPVIYGAHATVSFSDMCWGYGVNHWEIPTCQLMLKAGGTQSWTCMVWVALCQ